ncbi:MAG: hypothetical protein GY799_02130 [Desulfobulbaceae bacterium]|nr:hypothetical protein [Desulfobulbaceae bacterium]
MAEAAGVEGNVDFTVGAFINNFGTIGGCYFSNSRRSSGSFHTGPQHVPMERYSV